jgi:hypothetical protein
MLLFLVRIAVEFIYFYGCSGHLYIFLTLILLRILMILMLMMQLECRMGYNVADSSHLCGGIALYCLVCGCTSVLLVQKVRTVTEPNMYHSFLECN